MLYKLKTQLVQSQIALRKALVALQAKDFSKAKGNGSWFPRRFCDGVGG